MFLYNNENGHLYDIVMDDYLSVGLLILAIFCFRKLCANVDRVDRVDKYVAIFLFVVSCGLVCNTQLGRINDWRRLSERIAEDSFFLMKGELQSVGITQRDVLINIKGEKYTLSKERRFSARDELNKLKEGDHVELKIWDERMLTLSIYTVWVKRQKIEEQKDRASITR